MSESLTSLEGHARTKAARRNSIIDAAVHLAREQGADAFTVDQLASRAGVSRRTIFNHFESLSAVLLAAHDQVMTDLIEDFDARARALPASDGTIVTVFDETAQLLQETELVTPLTALVHLMGTLGPDDPGRAPIVSESLHRTTEQLAKTVTDRAHAAHQLDIDLLVHSLFDGLIVISYHWIAETGATTESSSREAWTKLLHHLIATVRNGYRN